MLWTEQRRRNSNNVVGPWATQQTFLSLAVTELRLVEMKLSLSARLQKARKKQGLTQAELADRMGSSQSRVAKMEAGDPSVSLDLLVQGLLATGASKREIASALVGKKTAA